jgi:hypothetical protein
MYLVDLHNYLDGITEGKGRLQGQEVRCRLEELVASLPEQRIFALWLRGITHIDSVFARVAVVELATSLRRQKAFYLVDVSSADLLENFDNAAWRCKQPLYVWQPQKDSNPLLLGPDAPMGTEAMLRYVQTHPCVRAHETVEVLHLSIQNASNKLKTLWESGYCLRDAHCVSSGGREYIYTKII